MTLTNGQCFGWRRHGGRLQWTGVLGQAVLSLRQAEHDTLFAVHHPTDYCPSAMSALLRDFLFLDRARLVDLYAQWSHDERFAAVGARLAGMRLLRQEPLECLVSFICSSCNNIARITQMTAALRRQYGQWLCSVRLDSGEADTDEQQQRADGEQSSGGADESFYAFPSVAQLACIPSSELRALGFGYRAEYVVGAAQQLEERGGLDWLTGWRSPAVSTEAVVEALQQLPGVGPKVAACVALFSLDRLELIPVDTHVHQIALRDYGGQLSSEVRRSKSVTKAVHASIAALFRDKFGPMAGWAHSVLFTAELPAFRAMLAADDDKQTAARHRASSGRKRQRGGEGATEAAAGSVEVKAGMAPSVALLSSSEPAGQSMESSGAMTSRVQLMKVDTTTVVEERVTGTLQFSVVKRARIPKKTSVIIQHTRRRISTGTSGASYR